MEAGVLGYRIYAGAFMIYQHICMNNYLNTITLIKMRVAVSMSQLEIAGIKYATC